MNKKIQPTILPSLLIYQDEDCTDLVEYLKEYGFTVTIANNDNCYKLIRNGNFDFCIFSHFKSTDAPDLRLLEFLRKILGQVPCIILTDQDAYAAKQKAYNLDTDDYMVRPCNILELIARINAIVKRYGLRIKTLNASQAIGKYMLNTGSQTLTITKNGKDIEEKIGTSEFTLLCILHTHLNDWTSLSEIEAEMRRIRGVFNRDSLRIAICRLRKLLSGDSNITIYNKLNAGYKLEIKEPVNNQ